MEFCFGIVEDRNDPLKIGRVRVRVHGYHTDNKGLISSADFLGHMLSYQHRLWSWWFW